ncbi:hypothetical protein AGOR_G00121610 [Albula goreensis]|uniref:RHD domain-containing protein n=1 Tax=Albula goreensis TaxID=1534307 RepID=A0A8T3DFI6_9TELE|nr:hypothetical protein AGOR_G00121610 [Albula goreensis]
MKNMSTREATPSITGLSELDLIDEYLKENESAAPPQPLKLPGPPPPPRGMDLQELSPVTRPANPHPILVPRSTAPPLPCPLSQVHIGTNGMTSSHSSMSQQGAALSRRGRGPGARGMASPRVSAPSRGGVMQQRQTENEYLESILGASSTEANKTLPAVEIKECGPQVKRIKITVSLVTKDIPHRPHPHSLVGKDCADGVCVIRLNPRTSCRHSFSNLGIQCVRRKELEAALEKRRKQKIDPFNTGQSKSIEDIDMNVVRLCFQCELEIDNEDRVQLSPVVSNAIYDKKATTTSELKINRLNVVRGPCTGKTEIYLLCDKVQKDDIEIIFSSGQWEAKAEFAQTDVHRQIAIVFKSPPYQEQDITDEVVVNVFLRRLSDHMDSEPVQFTYMPQNQDPFEVHRKRKIKSDNKFNDRCTIAAQNMTIPEPPCSHQFNQLPFFSADLPQPELPHLAQGLDEIHYSSVPMDVKQEDNLCLDLVLDSTDFQALFTGISQALEGSAACSQLSGSSFPEQQGCRHPNAILSTGLNQDPNSNYALPGMDLNCNVPGDSRSQLDSHFYNDVCFNHYSSQLANGTHLPPLAHPHPQPLEPLLEDLATPAPQPLRPCDSEDPNIGLCVKTESHIEL